MRKAHIFVILLLVVPTAFAQTGNNEPLGGKTGEAKTAPARKKSVPKATPNQSKDVFSPCFVYYRTRAEMNRASNPADNWFSLGQSANKRFWYNPRRTTCDAQTGVLKSWIKEEHKNTDGNFALVLYEFKCKTNQMRVKTVIEYDQTGAVLDTNNHDNDPWQEVAPGTAGDVMIRTVCRRPS